MAQIIVKGLIGEEDVQKYDGTATTFTRANSTGGTSTLTPVGAGSSGLKFVKVLASSVVTLSANPAASGVLRLATADSIAWRNNANGGDVALAKNTNDSLTFGGFVQPQVVAVLNLTGQTAAIGQTTLYTVPAGGAGMYRASVSLILTTAGTGGVIFENTGWNNGTVANTVSTGNLSTTTTLGTEINSYTTGATCFYSAAGTTITYQTTFSGVTGSPAYSIRIRLEYLG